mmetsp:Transcript_89264/g.157964  ORF Transcript_89264/g.157964 Transcript_89264/m.157964 type:complete len:205 (+) Transcript_89264:559-1173(+)
MPTVRMIDMEAPMTCAKNCARGEALSRCPAFKACMRSPACIAADSANAPATRFVTTCPGASIANITCDSLPTPVTGLRSVWPKARTARTATRHESITAKAVCHGGMSNVGEMINTTSTSETPKPLVHQAVGTKSDSGAISIGSPSKRSCEILLLMVAAAFLHSLTKIMAADVRDSASINPIETQSSQPCAPALPQEFAEPEIHP